MGDASENENVSRILKGSLKLFNRQGVERTTMRDIARDARISPGNLTYHFKKKSDIVGAQVDALELELTNVIEKISVELSTAEQHVESLFMQMQVLWKYRFFFNSLSYLISEDARYQLRFLEFRDSLVRISTSAYEQLADNGSVKPVDSPGEMKDIMENIWYLWFSLLRLYPVVTTHRKSEKDFQRFTATHIFSFLEPYYSDPVKKHFRDELNSRFD